MLHASGIFHGFLSHANNTTTIYRLFLCLWPTPLSVVQTLLSAASNLMPCLPPVQVTPGSSVAGQHTYISLAAVTRCRLSPESEPSVCNDLLKATGVSGRFNSWALLPPQGVNCTKLYPGLVSDRPYQRWFSVVPIISALTFLISFSPNWTLTFFVCQQEMDSVKGRKEVTEPLTEVTFHREEAQHSFHWEQCFACALVPIRSCLDNILHLTQL